MAGQVLIVLVSILAQRGGVIWVRLINALLPNLVFCEGSLDVVILGLLLYFTRKNRRWLSVGYLFYCGLAAVQLADRGAGGWKLELALAACLPVDDGRLAAADALL